MSYQEITAWMQLTGHSITPNEVELLHRLSSLYANSLVYYYETGEALDIDIGVDASIDQKDQITSAIFG